MNSIKKIFRKKALKKISVTKLLISLLVASLLVWFIFDYVEAKKQVRILSGSDTQQETYEEEALSIISEVKKLIVLPEERVPEVATIQNAQALSSQQPFFNDAKDGDVLLIYQDRAIIFRPSESILVNVGPVYAEGEDGDVTQDDEIKNQNENSQE